MAAKKAKTKTSAKAKFKAAVGRVKSALASVTKRRTSKAKAAPAAPAKKAKRARQLGHRPTSPLPKTATRGSGAKRAAGTLAEGRRAPRFTLLGDDAQMFSSHVLEGEAYVLYFYPKDDTPGCTTEACDFRDHLAEFSRAGVRVFGISPDSPNSHARFKSKHDLPFTLLSDEDRSVAKAFGVWVKKQNYGREYMGIERSTFLIGRDGKIKKIWRGVRVPGHVQAVLTLARDT